MFKINLILMLGILGLVLGLTVIAGAQTKDGASPFTQKINAAVLHQLPFANRQDFEDAQRGFIAPLPAHARRETQARCFNRLRCG